MALASQAAVPPGSAAQIAEGPCLVTITNTHASVDLYVGGDENQDTSGQKRGGSATSQSLAITTGFRVAGTKSLTLTLGGGEVLYGRSSNATVTLSVMVFRTNVTRGGGGLT